jgi:hypothetical protein
MARLDAAKKEHRAAIRERNKERAPMAKAVRVLKDKLRHAHARRERMLEKSRISYSSNAEENMRSAEFIYQQEWRDNAARIAAHTSALLTAELALAFFDKGQHEN